MIEGLTRRVVPDAKARELKRPSWRGTDMTAGRILESRGRDSGVLTGAGRMDVIVLAGR